MDCDAKKCQIVSNIVVNLLPQKKNETQHF